jgi:predicted membrane protein
MPGIQLTATELAALDVIIAAMRAKVGGGQAPGGFINDIVNITAKITDATRVVIPVVQATTQLVGVGAPGGGDPGSLMADAINKLPPGVTLDQLIQLRNSIART